MTSASPNGKLAEIAAAIRDVPDFPKPGILFKDITPVLASGRLFEASVEALVGARAAGTVDLVAGIEARGFVFAAAAALQLGAGFIPIRKQGKLPYRTCEETYALEYGTATIAVHADALRPGSRVLLLDDLLATGGTAEAAVKLLRRLGADVIEVGFLVELTFLKGRERLSGLNVRSQIQY